MKLIRVVLALLILKAARCVAFALLSKSGGTK